MNRGQIPGCKKLIESSVPDRGLYQLIFRLVESLGNLEIDEFNQTSKISKVLFKREDIIQRQHPTVSNWINKHKTIVS